MPSRVMGPSLLHAGIAIARHPGGMFRPAFACLLPSGLALSLVAAAFALSGCAAIAPAAVGTAALSGGGRVKAGTEYGFGGTAYRTFSKPVKDVYEAVHETLQGLEISTKKEAFDSGIVRIHGVGIDRTFSIKLDPITPTLTRMKLVVRQHGIGKDRSTAAELINQVEHHLHPRPPASPPP